MPTYLAISGKHDIHREQNDRVYRLAATLAWAVRHRLPLGRALESVQPGKAGHIVNLFLGNSFIGHIISPIFTPRARFQSGVADTAAALHSGLPLAEALEKNMRHLLPEYYIAGVRAAADAGKLEELLPVLAESLKLHGLNPQLRRLRLMNLYFLVILSLLVNISGVLCFIIPKFVRINEEFGEGEALPASFELLLGAVNIVSVFSVLFVLLIILLIVSLPLWLLLSKTNGFYNRFTPSTNFAYSVIELIYLCIPILGTWARLRRRLELAQCLHYGLRSGQDILDAAEWTHKASSSIWLRRRLQKFADGVCRGQNWQDAWVKSKIGDRLMNYMALNSAATETPARGFRLMAEFTAERLGRFERLFECWLRPVMLLPLALITFVFASGFFLTLAKLTEMAVNLE